MEILEWGPCVIKARLPFDFVDELISKGKNEVSANSMLAGQHIPKALAAVKKIVAQNKLQ